jgi:Flp pilus assembly protein protease CpaA
MVLASRVAAAAAVMLLQLRAGSILPAATPVLAALGQRRTASLPYCVAIALGGCWLVRDLVLA